MQVPSNGSRRRNMVLLVAFMGWMFDGLEMGIFPLIARPALLEMQAATGVVDDTFIGYWMGIVTALFLLGAALGGLVFGWLGDKMGRVRAMSLAILCYSLFTGLAYFVQAPLHLGVHSIRRGRAWKRSATWPGWPTDPAKMSAEDRRILRKQIEDSGLALPSLLESISLKPTADGKAQNLDRLKRAVAFGNDLAPPAAAVRLFPDHCGERFPGHLGKA